MDKRLRDALLFDFYGDMLTKHRREICRLHFFEDMSFAEIAERQGITRQAANQAVQHARKTFAKFERALGLLSQRENLRTYLDEMGDALDVRDFEKCNEIFSILDELI